MTQAVSSGHKDAALKISIITVVYNDKDGLLLTIKSVRSQRYSNIEHIVIDGASTDGTATILSENKDRLAFAISESDEGLYDAMNKGLDLASGDFCLFLNAGDVFSDSEVVQSAVSNFSSTDASYFMRSIICGDGYQRLVPPADVAIEQWLGYQTPNHESVFFPRAFYQNERYDLTYFINSDGDFMHRCFRKIKPIFIPIVGLSFATGGLSNNYSDWNVVKKWIADRRRLDKNYFPHKRFKFFKNTVRPITIFLLKRVLGNHYFTMMKLLRRYEQNAGVEVISTEQDKNRLQRSSP